MLVCDSMSSCFLLMFLLQCAMAYGRLNNSTSCHMLHFSIITIVGPIGHTIIPLI
uniref:G-protein coupled receptors family 1 profile domain-containing protein n=1 Tax=Anguilla anguilla TaxID=7936 RepID=A0A0E9SPG3_ANGAN